MSSDLQGNPGMTGLHPSHQPALRGIAVIVALLALGVVLAWMLPSPNAARGIAGYLPLHILMEIASVVISMLVFAVGWNDYSGKISGNLSLLACAFFGVACLDFTHTFSFYGMPDFVTPNGPDKAIYFWLAARALAAAGLLLAVAVTWRESVSTPMRYTQFAAVLVVVGVLHWLFLFHQDSTKGIFLVPGKGLTPLKLYLEYAIIASNVATVFVLWMRMRKPLPFSAVALFGAVCTMAMSEFFFTLYAEVTDVFNLLGHIYKIISYMFIYKAFVVTMIEAPYRELSELNRKQQRTTEALRMSEERYRQVFEKSGSVLLIIEPDSGVILDANASAARFYGYSIEQLRAMNIDQINTLTPEKVAAERASAAKAERDYFIFPHRLASGDVRMVEVQSTPVEIDNRIVLFSIVHDITERIQAESSLNNFFEQPMNMHLIAQLDGVIRRLNGSWNVALGYDQKELVGTYFLDLVHPDDKAATVEQMSKLAQGVSIFHFENRYRHKNGEFKLLAWSASVSAADQLIYAVASDITERKQAEAAVRKSEERYRQLFDTSLDSILVTAPDGSILSANPAACRMFQRTEEDLRELGRAGIVDISDPRVTVALEERGRTEHFQGELAFLRKDGSGFEGDVATALYRDKDGNDRTSMIIRDVTERKRVISELLESESRYRRLIESSPDIVYVFSNQRGGIFYSPRVEALLGYHPDYMYAHPFLWRDSIHTEDIPKVKRAIESSESGKPFAAEYRIKDAQGQWHWFLDRSTEVRAANGESLIEGLVTDITERKKAEDVLRESEFRWKFAIEGSGDGLWDWNVPESTVFFTTRWKAMLGYAEDEIGNGLDEWSKRIHPDDLVQVMADVQAHLDGTTPLYVNEHRVSCKDGSWKWILDRGLVVERDAASKPLRMIGTHTDVTERKLSETAIRQSSEEQTAMFEAATSGIAFIKNRVIVKGNRTLDHLFGYEPGEQAGLTTRHWYVDNEAYEVGGTPYAALARGEIHQREQQLVRKDGTKFWCRLSGSAIEAADLSRGTVWMLTEVTQEHEVAEALRQAKDAAEAANRAKSEFLANMSHEIRTPLNGLMGNAQLLEMSGPTNEQKEYLSAIMLSGSNLLSLINDILDLSKIEAEKVVLEKTDFSLRGCFNNVVRTQRLRIANKGLSLKLEIPNDVPDALIGDELRVKQILLNLLGNAIKFTREGGITLSAAIKEQTSSKALIELALTDTGIGIPKAAADDIFKPFVQADSSTTRKYGGSGLGLTISRRLAELMGGGISVESTEGTGSTFRVLLPFTVVHKVVQEYSAPAVAPAALWTGATLNVLLAEDNEISQQFGVALLRKMGHAVTLTENGKEALAALEQAAFDLVLMDIQMPVMGGQEALALLREREKSTDAHLPVIALTAYALNGDEDKFFAAGFDGYVSKPLEVKKLVAEMKRILELKSTADSDGA